MGGHGARHVTLAIILTATLISAARGLEVGYYRQQCPHAEKTVKQVLHGLLLSDVTAGPALLRLAFHDCQVKACDASILLADDPGRAIESELHSSKNFGIRRLDFIDIIKQQLEKRCPGVVSCADIIVLAARDAIALLKGPSIPVLTGRKDSKRAYKALADVAIPPAQTSVDQLLQVFFPIGSSLEETVALLGSHTLGVSHCVSFEERLKPKVDKALNPELGGALKALCSKQKVNVTVGVPNDETNLVFDNQYFKGLLNGQGLLAVDHNIASDRRTLPTVHRFAASQQAFFNAYTTAFMKLTQSAVLSDGQGDVRKRCSLLN